MRTILLRTRHDDRRPPRRRIDRRRSPHRDAPRRAGPRAAAGARAPVRAPQPRPRRRRPRRARSTTSRAPACWRARCTRRGISGSPRCSGRPTRAPAATASSARAPSSRPARRAGYAAGRSRSRPAATRRWSCSRRSCDAPDRPHLRQRRHRAGRARRLPHARAPRARRRERGRLRRHRDGRVGDLPAHDGPPGPAPHGAIAIEMVLDRSSTHRPPARWCSRRSSCGGRRSARRARPERVRVRQHVRVDGLRLGTGQAADAVADEVELAEGDRARAPRGGCRPSTRDPRPSAPPRGGR